MGPRSIRGLGWVTWVGLGRVEKCPEIFVHNITDITDIRSQLL